MVLLNESDSLYSYSNLLVCLSNLESTCTHSSFLSFNHFDAFGVFPKTPHRILILLLLLIKRWFMTYHLPDTKEHRIIELQLYFLHSAIIFVKIPVFETLGFYFLDCAVFNRFNSSLKLNNQKKNNTKTCKS